VARIVPAEGFDLLKDRVQKAVSGLFPIVGKKNTLELHDVAVRDDLDSGDFRSQKAAKLEGKSWAVPVEATLSLKDNATGRVVDRQKIKLMSLPKTTNRYSYIVDGQEYQVDNQWRLKPGVYNMVKADGALESHFNAPGGGFKVHFDPASHAFSMEYGNSNIPLKPLLHAMGVPEEEVEKRWGKDIAVANHADMPKALSKFYKADTGLKPSSTMTPEDTRAHFWQVMDNTKMNPDVNMLTLGKAHSNVTGAALLDASDKLLKISRGDAKPDPRDAIMFKDLHSMEDFAAERITRGSKDILRKIGNTVDKKDKVRDIIAPDTFNKHVRLMFTKNSLASTPSQTNPLEMISAQFKTTITGEGGIKSEHTVSDEAKLIDPSHLGFLDPIHTPEGKDTGITLRLPIGVTKKDHDVTIKMYNLHTGKNEDVNPTIAYKSHVVLPDQVKWVDGKPVPIGPSIKISGIENEIYDGSMKGADYVMRDPMQMFSFASNLIPFMPADHPNRSTMAGRQMEQAVSLLHREAPLVQSLAGAHSFEHMVGGFASHHTRDDGTVTQIKPDAIVIEGEDGKRREVHIYDHFPLNEDKAFLHSTPLVKVGDKVKAGQIIADTNFSRGGVLAMGNNLRVGFMPYKGLNYEDGIVVTESAAKKLTSEHLHRHTIERDVSHVLDKRKFQAYIPTGMNRSQADKLDDEGVIKPGTVVMPGDTLIAALRASNESEKREDVQLSKLHKSIVRPFKDASVTWDNDYPGVVKEVVKTGADVAVHVKTEEPLEIGDKICGRHGNKGIVTCHDESTEILTDQGWRYFKDLDRTELICTRNILGEIEYQQPTAYIDQPHKGRMYKYAGRRLDVLCTPEHNHYVRGRGQEQFKLLSAEKCFGLPKIHVRTGKWYGVDLDKIVIPGRPRNSNHQAEEFCESREYDADDFLEFFGYWITEGCLGNDSHITIAQTKEIHPDVYVKITAVLQRMGYSTCEQPTVIVISDPRLHTWLKQFGKAKAKFIPRDFMMVSQRQLRILADALFEGDGGVYYREKDNHTRYELFTSSQRLSDDYQELALKLGMSANVKPQKGEYGTEYVVRWSLKDEVWTNNDRRFDNESWVDYVGRVYCVDVPNHVIYVRRNGIPVWSGNCIVPDHEAPYTKDGRPLDVLLNPLGVTGRTNLGQVLEVAAGKIAEKTGKTYFTKNFKPDADLHAQVTQDLAKHGLTDKETVFDPMNGRPMGDVLVGPMHMLKLHHQVEKKLSARALGYGYAYDRNKIPQGGGPHGAQSLGVLGLYAMLGHGAVANLREMNTWKSDAGQGDQFWTALQAGEMLPTPKPTFAYNKFISLIKGLNVNVEKTGNSLILSPMTDKQVHEMSNGELKDPSKMTIAKTMRPEPGGLFDPKITGGLEGDRWSHFVLPEAFPNPVFEGAIVKLTGIKTSQFDGLIGGTLAYDPATGKIGDPLKMKGGLVGGKAFNALLGKIDVKKDLAAALEKLQKPTLKGSYLDDANKRVKFLKVLDRLGVSPKDAYMMQSVPVLPPSMRPLPILPNGTISEEDINGLYKSLHLTASRYAKMSPLIPDEDQSKVELRQEVYDGLRALSGIGSFPRGNRRGILDYIAGKRYVDGVKTGPPKEGFFQEQLVTRKQDMTMRGTIIPEPSLSLDEVGIPKSAALELYKPFVIRELRNLMGISPLQAQQKMSEGGDIVDRALDRAILSRPILLKRDPVLHKYGIQAFKPRIVSGKAVQIHPLVTSGFNADFDGDSVLGDILVAHLDKTGCAEGMPHTGRLFSYKIIDLANFPHLPDPIRTTETGVTVYAVPPGTFVPAFDGGAFDMSEVTEYSVHPNCEEWRIETERGREMFVSEDHSLALLNPATLEVYDAVPSTAEGMWLPTLRYLNPGPAPVPSLPGVATKNDRALAMLEDVPATFDVGWFLGTTVGDGWVSQRGPSKDFLGKLKDESVVESRSVFLAYGADGRDVADKWDNVGKYISQKTRTGDISAPHKFGEYECQSFKSSICSTALGLWLEPLIGKGAANKHLPDGFLHFPVEFRQGLFCGLIDTDGTVNWSNGVNKAPQFSMSYSTVSPDLTESIQLLGLSLGLVPSCTATHTPAGKPSWVITFSIRTVQDADWIKLEHTDKRAALEKLRDSSKVIYGRSDQVPLLDAAKEELLEHLRTLGAAKRKGHGHNAAAFSSYTVLRQSNGGVSRITVQNLNDLIDQSTRSEYLSRWFALAMNADVGWDRVVASKATGEIKTMYDLKVPGPWTFTMANGAAVWDCMGAFVPVGSEAVAEAHKMFPSNNLFSPATGKLMYSPSGESRLGLYGLTRAGAATSHEFSTIQDVETAVRKGTVKLTDQVKVGGIHSTVGRFMVAGALPESMRGEYLGRKEPLNASAQEELMTRIAKEHKNEYGQSINKLKDLGNMWATQTAFSVGMSELAPDREARNRILAKADDQVSKLTGATKDAKTVEIYAKATDEMDKHFRAISEEGNNLMLLHNMGMKGGTNTIRQIRAAPMLMANHKGEIIPSPVRKSYAEGLDIAGYWTATSGGRKGVIQKVQAVQEPGHITKQVMNSTMNNLILDHDCGTDKGISLSIDEKDILDRFTAADVKLGNRIIKSGTLITPELRSAFRNNNVGKVVVRSPLRCLHGPGLCQKCFGYTEDGRLPEVGLNVGVLAGQAIGERATQLAMKAFHQGGTASSKSSLVDQFNQVQDLLLFPKQLPGSATLSTVSGKVTKIEKDSAGGHNVIIEEERHYIPQSRGVPVYDKKPLAVGTEVKKGMPISEGRVNPHEMLPLTGIEPVQALLASNLADMYEGQGIRRRNHEVVIKALTNLTKIKDAGSSTHYIRGDFAPTTFVSSLNRGMAKGEHPIVHEPILKGVNVLPLDMQEDWIAKLNHEGLANTVIDAAQQGWRSNLHSLHPVPAVVYAAELGKPPKDLPGYFY